jgi:RNA recognition motif-containing protein
MNLYVSNLSYQATDADLKKLFEPFGIVSSARIVSDRDTGRSRGFGFVELTSDEDAQKAISALNNKMLEGRAIGVSVAREKSARPDRKLW